MGITADNGQDILIHVGIDTVKMEGEGFEALAAQGDRIRRGQPLLKVDLDRIKEQGYSSQTMMIFPGAQNIQVMESDSATPDTVAVIIGKG